MEYYFVVVYCLIVGFVVKIYFGEGYGYGYFCLSLVFVFVVGVDDVIVFVNCY